MKVKGGRLKDTEQNFVAKAMEGDCNVISCSGV